MTNFIAFEVRIRIRTIFSIFDMTCISIMKNFRFCFREKRSKNKPRNKCHPRKSLNFSSLQKIQKNCLYLIIGMMRCEDIFCMILFADFFEKYITLMTRNGFERSFLLFRQCSDIHFFRPDSYIYTIAKFRNKITISIWFSSTKWMIEMWNNDILTWMTLAHKIQENHAIHSTTHCKNDCVFWRNIFRKCLNKCMHEVIV